MTPYDLEETKRRADKAVFKGEPMDIQIFNMLRALLQHEADKEAERCLAHHHAEEAARPAGE